MQAKMQQLELDMEQQTGSKSGKEFVKAAYCHPAYLTYMQSTSCEMMYWIETQVRIKIARRNINSLRYTDEAMAPHPSTLAWKIPWTEEPGGLPSMRLLRVGLL